MSIRSHVDPCLFIVFMHIMSNQLDSDFAQVVKAIQFRHGDPFNPILDRLQFRSYQVLFHENYHYWQGLRLPFLFRYALLAHRAVYFAFRELSRATSNFNEWSCLLPELSRLNLASTIGFMPNGRIFWSGENEDFPVETLQKLEIRPLDLLECAASLAEFQVMTEPEQRTDSKAFKRWVKRNPAYLDPFNFAAQFLDSDELALRLLLPLINASFHTTEPTRTFVELLARVWGNFIQGANWAKEFLAQQEPCRWSDLFQSWLEKIQYEAETDSCGSNLLNIPYQRLTLDKWVFMDFVFGEETTTHPFIGVQARNWRQAEKTNPVYSWLLDLPGWVDVETFRECRSKFDPPLTVFRFHLGEDSKVYLWGSESFSGFTSIDDPEDPKYLQFVANLLAMYGAVRRASGAHFDVHQRTCHHCKCPYFESNFCNAYPVIPLLHEECGFPKRMKRQIELFSGE